ncbi:MAG: hypothetical protein RIB65_00555 [Ilumatobacter fluminis]|uniref:hypothetical protein n=1 Tax=Ilumatobacter fluminis TaxID=467091 RepID=UPI0032ED7E53
MKDDATEALEMLEQRAELSTGAQLVGWVSGALRRSFEQRLREITVETIRYATSGRARGVDADVERAGRLLRSADRRRLESTVADFFESIEREALQAAAALELVEDDEPPVGLTREFQLILGGLLVSSTTESGAATAITSAVTSMDEFQFVDALMSSRLQADRSPVVLEGLLVGAVAAFEDLLVPLIRIAVLVKGDYLDREDPPEVILKALHKDASAVTAGGPGIWRGRLIDRVGIDLARFVGDWGAFVELHYRRNVVAHHGGRADGKYVSKVEALGERPPVLSSTLVVDADYVAAAVSMLDAVGSSMAALWPTLLAESDEERPRPSRPNDIVVRLLKAGRWADALAVASAVADYEVDPQSLATLRVNGWMAERELAGTVESIRLEVSGWTPPSEDRRWEIARAALLHDDATLLRLLRQAEAARADMASYTDWPLFRMAGTAVRAYVDQRRRRPVR